MVNTSVYYEGDEYYLVEELENHYVARNTSSRKLATLIKKECLIIRN